MYSWAQGADDDEDESIDNDYGGKSLIIFLVDCTKPMSEPIVGDSEGMAGIQKALSCALATIKNKIFGSDKDCIGVIGFGTKPSKRDDSDFETVRQVVPLGRPSAAAILSLEELLDPDTGSSTFDEKFGYGQQSDVCLHEALWQCQSSFSSVTGKVGRKTILLLTNSSDPHGGNSGLDVQARRKAVDLHNTDIFLDVIPVCGEDQKFDLERFYHVLVKLADDEAPVSVSSLSDLAGSVLRKTTMKRSSGHFKFELGGGLTIALSSFNLLGKSVKPSKQKLASDTNEEVTSSRSWIHPITGAPLLPSDMNRSVQYGGKDIQMTADEVKAISGVGCDQPALKLCGFKRVSSLRLGLHVRMPQFIYPHEASIVGSRMAFSALLQRCIARQVAAICQYKPRAASKLCFVALVPQGAGADGGGEDKPPGFHVVFLPYLDDLRKVPSIPLETANAPESVDAAKEVISKLRLKKFVPVENCGIQTHYKMIEAHALQKPTMEKLEDETLPDLDRMTRKLGDKSRYFLSCVYEDGYDPEAPPKKSAKPGGTQKKVPAANASADIDMKAEVAAGKVNKLTVDVLKAWLKKQGIAVGNKKKGELVQEVMDQF